MNLPDLTHGHHKYIYESGIFFLNGYDEGSYAKVLSELKFPCYIQFGQNIFKFYTKEQVKDYLNL